MIMEPPPGTPGEGLVDQAVPLGAAAHPAAHRVRVDADPLALTAGDGVGLGRQARGTGGDKVGGWPEP